MKAKYLKIRIFSCFGPKDRTSLPQIKDHDRFLSDVNDAGFSIDPIKMMKTGDLRPTQNAFDRKKILDLISSVEPVKPIVCTQEYYILDGHHRWAAAHETNKEIPVRVINMTHDQAMNLLVDKDYADIPDVINEAIDVLMLALSMHPKFKMAYHFYKGLAAKEGPSDNSKSRAARVAGVSPMMFSKFVTHKEKLEKAAQPAGAKK